MLSWCVKTSLTGALDTVALAVKELVWAEHVVRRDGGWMPEAALQPVVSYQDARLRLLPKPACRHTRVTLTA